jgi:hypothetical protein
MLDKCFGALCCNLPVILGNKRNRDAPAFQMSRQWREARLFPRCWRLLAVMTPLTDRSEELKYPVSSQEGECRLAADII